MRALPSRIAILAAAMLLGACVAHHPRPSVSASPRFVLPPHRPGGPNANDVLFRAIGLVGTPYRYGGNTPETGFDCSGLVDYVFRDAGGVTLPRTAQEIAEIPVPHVRRGELDSGDVVLFGRSGRVDHVGIYVGRGRFVHAPNSGGTVRLDYLDGDYWNEHFSGALRIMR
jgi:cell wall-associated NlpC family hydrolase